MFTNTPWNVFVFPPISLSPPPLSLGVLNGCKCVLSGVWSVYLCHILCSISICLISVSLCMSNTLIQCGLLHVLSLSLSLSCMCVCVCRFVSYHGMIGLVCGYIVAVKQYHPDSVPFPPPTPPTLRVKVRERDVERSSQPYIPQPPLSPLFPSLTLPLSPAHPPGCGHCISSPLSVWCVSICNYLASDQWNC